MPIQPCRPKSNWPSSGAIWAQFKPKQLNQTAIPAHAEAQPLGPNQPYVIGLYWPWFKGAKLDSKIVLYFTHRNGPIFRAKTDLSDLQFKSYLSQGALEPQSTFHLFTNQVYKPFYIRYEENKKNKQTVQTSNKSCITRFNFRIILIKWHCS